MKGCLGFIIKSLVTFFVGVGVFVFFVLGGFDYVKNLWASYFKPETPAVSASKIADFSNMPKDYKIVKAVDMLGVKAAVVENKGTSQKMAVVDPGWALNITKEDIKSKGVESRIKSVAKNFEGTNVKLVNFETSSNGAFNAFGQKVPYVKVKASIAGAKNIDVEGILGVASDAHGKNFVIFSGGLPGKYNQVQAEKFFKKVSLK